MAELTSTNPATGVEVGRFPVADPATPWGGVGASGFGRLRGADGLREFAQTRSIVVRQARSPLPTRTFARTDRDLARIISLYRRWYGRG